VDTKRLHDLYGPVVRIAPSTLSFSTASAWKGMTVFVAMFLSMKADFEAKTFMA